MKNNKNAPYRFTCNIPYEVVGCREATKDEDEAAKKIHKQIMEQFGLVKQGENKNEEKAQDSHKKLNHNLEGIQGIIFEDYQAFYWFKKNARQYRLAEFYTEIDVDNESGNRWFEPRQDYKVWKTMKKERKIYEEHPEWDIFS